VREELRGREPHYVDKRYRAQLADDELSAAPERSLYSLYWHHDRDVDTVPSTTADGSLRKRSLPFDGYDKQ